ncbi:hypothetical protein [Natrinema salinisoli]|uniref:hypothetical protein n=1 Tax=Natrinema salinisoli TaxID=2878535 RepID=UPI001CEFCB21|nr:hypothetical protein [Natrinema salinisoli]
MTWAATAVFGLCSVATGLFIYVLVANLEPQPEYPELMTDLLRVLGLAIAVCAVAIGVVFLVAAGHAYPW